MIKIFTSVLLLVSLTSNILCKGQEGYFNVESVESEHGDYSFSLVKHPSATEITTKINNFMQLYVLKKSHLLHEDIFSDMIDEMGYGTISLQYEILANNEAYLSIEFSSETQAAYPDYHSFYMTFNSATGDVINLNELLTEEGIDHLNDQVKEGFNEIIKKNFLASLEFAGSLEDEDLNQAIEVTFDLTRCNAIWEIHKFGLTENAIKVEKERCYPHAMRPMDISWVSGVNTKSLYGSDFTPYGGQLVKSKKPVSKTNYKNKTDFLYLAGKIDGKYPFTMYLDLYGTEANGYYWYDKFGDIIDLKGSRNENKLILKEKSGSFEIQLSDDGISGKWYGSKGQEYSIDFY